jgi:hypothetical protein
MPRADEDDFEEDEGRRANDDDGEKPTPVATSEPPKKNKGGRPRKVRPTEIAAASTPTTEPLDAVPLDDEMWSRDPQEVWARIIEKVLAKGLYPDRDVSITVMRMPSGPVVGEWQRLTSISGRAVYVPNSPVASGEMLMNYIQDVYHVSAVGPCKYELGFILADAKSRLMKKCQFVLGDPRELMAMKNRAAMAQQAAAYSASGYSPMPPVPSPYPIGMGNPGSYRPNTGGGEPTAVAAPAVAVPAPAPSGQSSLDLEAIRRIEQLQQQIAFQFGMMNAQQQAEAARAIGLASLPSPGPAPAAAPAGNDDARIARVVADTLRGMGIGAPPPETEEARIGRIVATTLRGMGFGAMPQAPVQAAPAYAPQGGFSSVVTQAKEQVGGLREMVKVFKELKSVESALGLGGSEPEEVAAPAAPAAPIDPNAPPFNVRPIPFTGSPLTGGQPVNWVDRSKVDSAGVVMKDDAGNALNKGFGDWAMEMAAANPGLAANLLEHATKILDQTAFGALLKRFAEAGGAQAAAAQAVSAASLNGMSNGAALGMGAEPGTAPPTVPRQDTLP